MPLFEVDVLHTFRMKYVIEGDSLEHAYDEITTMSSGRTADHFEELSQKFLGDQIIDGKQISNEEFTLLCAKLIADKNESSNAASGQALIRKINYKS